MEQTALTVQTLPNKDYPAGKPVSLVLRPECLSLVAPEEGRVVCRVEQTVFGGDRMEYHVLVGNEKVLVTENFFPGMRVFQPEEEAGIRFDPSLRLSA
jgi:ABC-type Fe3+/spermidine/putrescine transport system ATPase subunit